MDKLEEMSFIMQKNSFLDEKIIMMLNSRDKPTEEIISVNDTKTIEEEQEIGEQTIYTGLKIKNQWFDFEERLLVEDKIAIMIPKNFTPMDIETAKIKYPSEQRPGTILTDDTGTINIMFTYMIDAMKNEEAEETRDTLLGIVCRVNPGIKQRESGVEIISNKNVAYTEYTNPTIDGKLYNLVYFLEVHGNLLMGSLNCQTKDMKYWKPIAFEIMRSIQIQSEFETGK